MPARDPLRLVQALDAIVWEADFEPPRLTFASEGARRILGYPVEDWFQPGFWTGHIHPEDAPWVETLCRERAARGENHALEYRMLAADGRTVWLRDQVRVAPRAGEEPVTLYGVMVDITREKLAERQLREQRDLNAAVLDNVEALVVLLDPETRVMRANRACERTLGRAARSFPGRRFAEHFAPGPEGAPVEALLARVALERSRETCETRARRFDGGERTISWSFAPLRGEGADVTMIVATGVDITERLRAAQLLHVREEDLRHAQRMDALGRFAGGIAHDFNNALTAILGFSDVLAHELAEQPQALARALEIRAAAEHAVSLTAQLKAFGRKRELDPRALDLRVELLGMHDMIARLIGEDIVLDLRPGAEGEFVRCDPGQFAQIVLNLALNARDAMPVGGRLTIEIGSVTLAAADATRRSLPESCILMRVNDTGAGMDEATRARAFEPYFTTKGEAGTGLGLSSVVATVRECGGDATLESAPGVGTTVRLWFPRADPPAPEPGTATAIPDAGAEGTVLLVEDEPVVRRLMVEALRRDGWRVLVAVDAAEALQLFTGLDAPLDLLVTDVVMPGMNGRELAEQLLESRPGLRVLFVTGYSNDSLLRNGITPGETALLEKPFSPGQLARAARALLENALDPR